MNPDLRCTPRGQKAMVTGCREAKCNWIEGVGENHRCSTVNHGKRLLREADKSSEVLKFHLDKTLSNPRWEVTSGLHSSVIPSCPVLAGTLEGLTLLTDPMSDFLVWYRSPRNSRTSEIIWRPGREHNRMCNGTRQQCCELNHAPSVQLILSHCPLPRSSSMLRILLKHSARVDLMKVHSWLSFFSKKREKEEEEYPFYRQ